MSGRVQTRLFDLDTRTGRVSEIVSAVVVILSLIALVALTVVAEDSRAHDWLIYLEWVFWGLFTVEYGLRLYAAPRPLSYARSFYGIVDVLAVLAGVLSVGILATAKPLRLLRAARIFKVARYSSAVERFSAAFDDIKDELALFSGVTAVIAFIAAYGIWEFEHELNPAYGNLFECVYWSVASLTMGAEGIAPVTVPGKVLAMLLVLIGLGIVAVPSGLLASALSKTDPTGSSVTR